MRLLTLLISIWALLTTACGSSFQPDPNAPANPAFAGTTGHFDPQDGVPYISNGDPRMEERLRQQPPPTAEPQPAGVQPSEPKANPQPLSTQPQAAPGTTSQETPPPQGPLELRLRLKEFEISRYNKGQIQASRFGDSVFTIKIFFTDEKDPAVFSAPFPPNNGKDFQIAASAARYRLSGSLNDISDLKTKGDLTITDTKTGQTAEVLYEAYKAKLTVHTDAEKKVVTGSKLESQIQGLQQNTYGWVHNWRVVRGRAFYLVDIVKVVSTKSPQVFLPPPVLAFKGESKRTGDQDEPAISLSPDVTNDISLIGNSETQNRRWFQTKLQDSNTHDEEDIILDVQDEMQLDDLSTGDDTSTGTDDNGTGGSTADLPAAPGQPPVKNPAKRPVQVEPVITNSAYLRIDNSLPRTARMSRDFARNRNLPGVKNFINIYTRGKRHGDLLAFYKYANPFRPMIEAVGHAFDVSPSFAYLTVIESQYMKSGYYRIEPINSAGAYGAFQFKPGTARGVGMRVDGGEDERKYFAPSACGAATYIGSLVNTFMNSDTTLAILGYNQGSGGAARAIYCSYEDHSQCRSRNFNRYLKFAKNYSFKYADMDSVTAIPKEQRDYVDAKLAIYFVSSDMDRYGLKIPAGAPRTLPRNGSVFPPSPINNSTCRAAINSLTGT